MTNQPEDPFAETSEVDEDDPFATAEDVKSGGGFSPSPKWDDLEGRLVAIFPRDFTDQAPDPFSEGGKGVRDRWVADLVVLDGPAFTFEYQGPPKEDGSDRDTLTEQVDEVPALFRRKYVHEQSIIGQINKAQKGPRPVLTGRVTRGPQAKDRRAGKTVEDIAAAFEAWRKNPRGNPPRFSWQIDVDSVTETDREVARRWLKTARAGGFTV
jgi:hypothetical protein